MTSAQDKTGSATKNPIANSHRGEAAIEIGGKPHLLRPTFEALVLAEEELGPLFALVERAGEGRLKLQEMADLFWFCLVDRDRVSREAVGKAVMEQGLAQCARPLRSVLAQILQGRG